MIDRKEVELLVRANLTGSKQQLSSLAKSIGEVDAAIDKQVAAAKRGETSIDELKASLAALQLVQQQLGQKADLIGQFQRLGDSIDKAASRVNKTADAFAKYQDKIKGSGELTEKQAADLKRLSDAHDRAQGALARQLATQEQLSTSLREAGIETNALAAAEDRIRTNAAQIGVAITKTSGAITTYAEDVRKARDAEKALTESKAFDQKLADAAKLGKSADYVLFWERALERAEVAEKQLAADTSLRKQADDAVLATRGFQTLANASSDLTPKIVSLRQAVNDIINPGQAARSTLAGVEEQVKTLATSVGSIKGPVKDADSIFKQLAATQKALGDQAGLVDQYRRTTQAVREARAEFTQARQQVGEYAAQVRLGGEAGAGFTRSLADAQARAKAAAQALNEALVAARASRQALTDAGLSASKLANDEQRLVEATRTATNTIRQLSAALDEHGQASNRAARAKGLFNDEGRTTLSLAQRIRGELLALAATYTGLQGTINLAAGALKAFQQQQTIENRLSVVVESSDPQKIAERLAFVKKQADFLGVSIGVLADKYSEFALAAKGANLTQEQTDFIFQKIAGGMRVQNLGTEAMNRAWTQFNQIIQKSKPEMEDLRTIAESGFAGVQGLIANGLRNMGVLTDKSKTATQDMFAQMKKGGLDSATVLFALARQIETEYGERLPKSVNSLNAEIGRLHTEWFNFQKQLVNEGAFKEATKSLADFLKSDQGQKFADSLASKFKAVAELIVLIVKHFDSLLIVSAGFFAIWAAGRLVGIANDLQTFATAAKSGAAGMTLLQRSVVLLQVAIAAVTFGSWLNQFDIVRKAAVNLVFGISVMWPVIRESFGAAVDILPDLAKKAMAGVMNAVTFMARNVVGIFAKIARAGGLEGVADSLEAAVKFATVEVDTDIQGKLDARRKKLLASIATDRKILEDTMADIERGNQKVGTPLTDPNLPTPKPPNRNTDPSDAEIAKRERLVETIKTALDAIDARIDRVRTNTLAQQLTSVDEQYRHLRKQIDDIGKFDPSTAKEFATRLATLAGEERAAITKKFNDDLAKQQEQLQRNLEAADAAAGRKNKNDTEARLHAIELTYESHYREIAAIRQKLVDNQRDPAFADQAKTRLDAAVAELKQLELKKIATEELARKEKLVTEAIEVRDKLVAAARAGLEVGKIDDVEAARRINEANAEAVPKIQEAAEATRQWALAHKEIFANPDQLAAFLAVLDATVLKATQVRVEFDAMGKQIVSGGVNAINNGLISIIDNLGAILTGQKSVAQGFKDIGRATLGIFAQFLKDIAVAILKLAIFNLMKKSGNPFIAAIGAAGAGGVVVKHAGGMVGRVNNRTRHIDPAYFANAPRYHGGGFAGMKPNEVPAILEQGEEVLSKNSPRNMMNADGTGAKKQSRGVRFVLVDDRSKVAEAMATAEGEEVILQTLRRNSTTIKQWMRN